MYTPKNGNVYLKAFAGYMAGVTAPACTDTRPKDYTAYGQQADAYAQCFDTLWGLGAPTCFETDSILTCSESVWENRSPLPEPAALVPGDYTQVVESVIARVRQGNAQVASEGIDPDAGCGGRGSGAPLKRTRWVDGDTTTPAPSANGAAGAPYKTISAALHDLAALPAPPSNAADGQTSFSLLVSPAASGPGYVENLVIPAGRCLEIRSLIHPNLDDHGATLTGTVAWANGAVADQATIASLTFTGMKVTGTITVTDGVGSSDSFLQVLGDIGQGPPTDQEDFNCGCGNIDTTGAALLFLIRLAGVTVSGTIDGAATVSAENCTFLGAIGSVTPVDAFGPVGCIIAGNVSSSANQSCVDCQFSGTTAITAGGSIGFENCTFSSALLVTSASISFDGPSYRSFLEAGGTCSTIPLIIGGYQGAAAEGAALTDANVQVSLDGTDATAGFTGGGNHYTFTATLATTSRTVRALAPLGGGQQPGDTIGFTIINTNEGGFNYNVADDVGTHQTTIPAGMRGFCILEFNGTHWVFREAGQVSVV